MDKLEQYRCIIKDILEKHAKFRPSHGQIETAAIYDPIHDHYLLMGIGWDRTGRVHDIAFHMRIQEGKIWIEWDGTEYGVAQELIDAGVPKEDIVLAFYHPENRARTEFTVA